MKEHKGGAEEAGQPLTVVGTRLEVGDDAPDFELDYLSGSDFGVIRLADLAGSVIVLNVVNSVDTPVCDVQTRRLDTDLTGDAGPEGVQLVTVSMDLPFALARWVSANEVRHPAASSHRSEKFGHDYGVLIKEWRAFQRSIFVIGSDGKVSYVEYVLDQDHEPDYDAAEAAAQEALSPPTDEPA
ncbi:MAG: thioredoxin-dependent peroxiredoxin [Actinomycetota bacterium]|jgi:thiol peroxidase|nr:thioredoxin-dependent peroxiredoxin [Actinomycetota bacterium]